jgi:hypothetical protein
MSASSILKPRSKPWACGAFVSYIAKWTAKDDDETAFCSVKLDLRTITTVSDSPKFSQYFIFFEHGTPDQWCCWNKDFATVCKGLNLTNGANQIGMVQHLLGGQV